MQWLVWGTPVGILPCVGDAYVVIHTLQPFFWCGLVAGNRWWMNFTEMLSSVCTPSVCSRKRKGPLSYGKWETWLLARRTQAPSMCMISLPANRSSRFCELMCSLTLLPSDLFPELRFHNPVHKLPFTNGPQNIHFFCFNKEIQRNPMITVRYLGMQFFSFVFLIVSSSNVSYRWTEGN